MATTLFEYYSGKGQALPSVKDRAGSAAQAGIQNYTGTAQQNQQLLGYLSSNNEAPGISKQTANQAEVIPVDVALGGVKQMDLPNKPAETAPSNLFASSQAYLSTIPKTGVAGLDSITDAMVQRPGQLAQQYGISDKQTIANERAQKLELFNEEYRRRAEEARTNPQLGAETLQSRLGALERERAFTAGTLAIEAAFANQDYTNAKSLMNDQLEIELEPLKMRYKFFEDMYNRTEDQKFQRAMKAEDRAYQSAKEQAQLVNDYKEQAIKNGIDPKLAMGITSVEDYYNLLGEDKGLSETAIDLIKTAENINLAATERTRGFRRGVGRRGLLGLRGAREVPIVGTKVADFRSDLDRLKGLLAKDNLSTLKGTISDKDIAFLERLGTSLNYTMTEKKFKDSLNELNDTFIRNYGVGFKELDLSAASPDEYLMKAPASNPAISNEQFF